MGATVLEAIQAAQRLAQLGTGVDVVCVTSPDLLFRATQARRGVGERRAGSSTRCSPTNDTHHW